MTQDELTLVLEALKWCHGGEPCGTAEAITVVEKALAQTQEPVALETLLKWDDDIDDIDPIGEVVGFIEGSPYIMVKVHKGKQVSLDDDLYATPPQRSESSGKPSAWVGLTDEEIQECYSEAYKIVQGRQLEIAFYKTIEAKLKQKNGYAEEKNT